MTPAPPVALRNYARVACRRPLTGHPPVPRNCCDERVPRQKQSALHVTGRRVPVELALTTAREEVTTNTEPMGSHPASASALSTGASSALLPRRFQPQLTLGFQHDLSQLAAELITLTVEERLTRLSAAIDVVETSRIELVELGVPAGKLQPTIAYSVIEVPPLLRTSERLARVVSASEEGEARCPRGIRGRTRWSSGARR
jgi:hypothetical protein